MLNKFKGIFAILLTMVLVSACFPPGLAYSGEPSESVLFGSKMLEEEVRKIIDKPVGGIYGSELEGITGITLTSTATSAQLGQYMDLTGLELLPGLADLSLNIMDVCSIKNIEVLRRLPKLKTLRMQQLQPGYYPLKNLNLLSNLKNLRELSLINFRDLDITGLAEFPQLQKLSLSYCGINDISPLSSLSVLEELNLTGNEIEDISPLQNLDKITSLYLEGNIIKNYDTIFNDYENYTNKDFILEKDAAGKIIKTDIESADRLLFSNRDTEAMVRILLGKPTGYLTPEELGSIKSLEMTVCFNPSADNYLHSYDLQDLSKLTGLESLNLQFNKWTAYTNLEAVGKLTKLEKLSILPYSAGLEDISAFGTLANLKEFDVPFLVREENLNTLKKLTGLEKMKWPGKDLSPLAAFKNLRELTVPGDAQDFSVLSKLPQLTTLHIEGFTTPKNLASLKSCTNIKSLDISYLPLSDIAFLSGLTGLERLQLVHGDLKSFKALSKLHNLIELDLSGNEISDITPLAQLKKLEVLKLESNKISNLSTLKSLSRLKELDLSVNLVRDISVLKGLKALEALDLSNNYINGLKPLEGLTGLKKLSLFRCGISDISPLAAMTGMEVLHIGSNNVTDISPLKGMTQMKLLDASLNKVEDIASLKDMKQLAELGICYNKIGDITPLNGLNSLEKLDLRFNNIADAGPILKATRLTEMLLDGNPIKDYIPLQVFKNATKAYITGLNKPGYVFGDAAQTDTTAYWNGKAIPCIRIGSSYAIAVEDLNYYGYDAAWQKVNGDDTARWQIKRNDKKPVSGKPVTGEPIEDGKILEKAMYAINFGRWEDYPITIVGVNSKAYILADELEEHGFDVILDKTGNVLDITHWDK